MAIVIPSSIYQATPTEKAQLYNSLLSQGYSDEEIRVAAGAPRDDNWALLQSIAQNIRPVENTVQSLLASPAEEAAFISAQPEEVYVAPSLLAEAPAAEPSLLAEPPQTRPTAVLFGDSMSEYVGYKPDGTPDTKYGNSIADVIGNNLGIQVTNLATGGETSNEALAGGQKFGAFQSYIEQNKPQYAIIRYGAADAIKNQDPQTTLQSVQKMVDIAKANGVTPIIVGVSELYGAQNSKTGNIAGYIDPGAENRANQINDGLKQIAQNAGVSFTDVRSATSAGKGDLLDGVHTNADFGKKMADAISEDIAAKSVIAEAKVPPLPQNVDSLSNKEKGALYNDLISQGYTDAQIRTAARAESDQDWNALKNIAAEVKNTTPAAIENQARVPQSTTNVGEPAGLLSQTPVGDTVAQTNRFSGLFASPDVLADKAQEVLAQSGRANDPRFADAIVGSFTQNGISYNVQGDGSIQGVIETPTGAYLAAGFTPSGQQATEQLSTKFEQTSTDRLLGTLANAAIAAGTAAGLGPAGVGLLGTPAAAAVGAGTTSFANSGDLAQALKAAALGGAAAFGLEQLFPTAVQTAAKTATDLATSGASQTEIVTALVDQGVKAGTAAQIAGDALGGASASQIASDFAGITIGGTTAAGASTLPNVVTVTAPSVAPSLLATAAPSLAGAAAGGLLGGSAPTGTQTVQVQAPTQPTQTSTAPAAAVAGLLAPTQAVQVQAPTAPAQTQPTAPAAAAVGGLLAPTQTVPVQGTNLPAQTQPTAPAGAAVGTLAPTQTVPVESRTIKTETPSILAPVAAGVVTTPRGEVPTTTYEVPRSSTGPIEGSTTINPLLALGLLGLAGTALAGDKSTAPPFDQAAYDAIAKGRSPVYPGGGFVPGFGGGFGMYQIAPTDVYNYFGPPYGAGRFGATVQPFTLPGLLGPNMTTPSMPSRASSLASMVGSNGF